MIPNDCKRLAEVDFPIAEVSKHSAREKSIRHGHPSTLHLWWARRPLAACRAMLMALLYPDPCDPLCPGEFKDRARKDLPGLVGSIGPTDEDLRQKLLKFIADFANWDNSTNVNYLNASRALVKAAHGEEPPLVVDPFAGGGSIPLEALRLGCDAFASDLNPVACLILKVMLEDIPRHGPELADELRRVGAEIKKQAEKELADLYPKDADGSTPIAYLWARTVQCESPNCGAEIPLMRSFWLCKKANRKRALRSKVHRPKGETPYVEFSIFEPKSEKEVHNGTVARAKATCLSCGTVLPPERVRTQLTGQRGGADVLFDRKGYRKGGAIMLAVVTLTKGEQGRSYRLPTDRDYESVRKSQEHVAQILEDWEKERRTELCPVPDETLPLMSGVFNVPIYGMNRWGDMFSRRQASALVAISSILRGLQNKQIKRLMTAVLSRCADYWSSGVVWAQEGEFVAHTFGRQALPMVFDFAEAVPWSDSSGNFDGAIEWVASVVDRLSVIENKGQIQQADARESVLPHKSASVWFTDPPYYFAVPYADLSDYFFVWIKRVLVDDPMIIDKFEPSNLLTHKNLELCEMAHWDSERYPHKDKVYFEEGMKIVFESGRKLLKEHGVGSVVFAHKTTEGWEAMLSGMIKGGWTITASWPIATERPGRLRSQDSAALATSVHLVCRPRSENASVGDWADVLRELPKRVGDWMERLQTEGIRGADLVFACIGPALEIFSKFSHVETADGREVKLAEYLEKVWEVVGRTALENILGTAEARARNGAAGALEEDSRLTALFLWTLQSTAAGNNGGDSDDEGNEDESEDDDEATKKSSGKGFSLVFDVVRRFAQPLGIDLPKWEGRIIATEKGVVRLLPVSERAQQLFGEESTKTVSHWLEKETVKDIQEVLFPEMNETHLPKIKGRKRKIVLDTADLDSHTNQEATTLDRVHAAMLLQSSGQTNALRALIKVEMERGPDFIRLANALSGLYPDGSEEERLVDAMLMAVPR